MKNLRLSPLAFLGSMLCFLLPFVTVSCNGHPVNSVTGLNLVTGTTLEAGQAFGPPMPQKVPPDPFAIVAVLCALIALVLSFMVGKKLMSVIVGASGVLSLLILKMRISAQEQVAFVVSFDMGYYLALLLLALGVAGVFLLWRSEHQSSATLRAPVASGS